jgi:hypothetical protein
MSEREPRAEQAEQPATGSGWYLYGVIRADALAPLEKTGVLGAGDAVLAVRHGAVCALGSPAPVDGGRETLVRHADLVQRVFDQTTILPARYGVVLPDAEGVVAKLLGPYHEHLVAQLDRLEGTVQIDVTGVHVEARALGRLLKADRALAARRHEANRGYAAAVRLGQHIAAGLERMRMEDAATALDLLRRHAIDERGSALTHEHMFLHASFLVRATGVAGFDNAVGELRRRLPHAVIRGVGPRAPYGFVQLEAEAAPAWA